MSSATLRDAMQKVRDPAANAVADIREHGGRLREDLGERSRDAAGAFRDARRAAGRAASRVGDEMSHGYEVARDYTRENAQKAWGTMRRHPTASIAVAVGVGLLIGTLLWSRR